MPRRWAARPTAGASGVEARGGVGRAARCGPPPNGTGRIRRHHPPEPDDSPATQANGCARRGPGSRPHQGTRTCQNWQNVKGVGGSPSTPAHAFDMPWHDFFSNRANTTKNGPARQGHNVRKWKIFYFRTLWPAWGLRALCLLCSCSGGQAVAGPPPPPPRLGPPGPLVWPRPRPSAGASVRLRCRTVVRLGGVVASDPACAVGGRSAPGGAAHPPPRLNP